MTSRSQPRGRAHPAVIALLVAGLVGPVGLRPAPAAAQLPAPAVSSPAALHVGAYGGVVVGRARREGVGLETDLTESNVALLVSGTVARRLSYFGELGAASTTRETWTGREEDRAVELVRLYAEYTVSDAFRVRVGRFLTPIGQWNEIHAEPLTWTALRPLTSYRPFARSTTGALVAGELGLGPRDLGWAAYVSVRDPLSQPAEESAFRLGVGGRVAVEALPGLYLGASGGVFRASRPVGPDDEGAEPWEVVEPGEVGTPEDPYEEREEDRRLRPLVGADLSWRIGRLELLSEAAFLVATPEAPAERGAFVQAAVPVVGGLYLVARGEVYDPVVTEPIRIGTLGLTWRAGRHFVLKAERQLPDRPSFRIGDGWYASLSALF